MLAIISVFVSKWSGVLFAIWENFSNKSTSAFEPRTSAGSRKQHVLKMLFYCRSLNYTLTSVNDCNYLIIIIIINLPVIKENNNKIP